MATKCGQNNCKPCYKPDPDKDCECTRIEDTIGCCQGSSTEACRKILNSPPRPNDNFTMQQIAAAYAMANDPAQFRRVLVANGVVANPAVANALTSKQAVNAAVTYYVNNGAQAYGNLLKQFIPNSATKNFTTDPKKLNPLTQDLINTVPEVATLNAQINAAPTGITTQSFGFSDVDKWLQEQWGNVVGAATSNTTPVVTTTTSASPVTIGLIIGGVAVLAILAWVVIKA